MRSYRTQYKISTFAHLASMFLGSLFLLSSSTTSAWLSCLASLRRRLSSLSLARLSAMRCANVSVGGAASWEDPTWEAGSSFLDVPGAWGSWASEEDMAEECLYPLEELEMLS